LGEDQISTFGREIADIVAAGEIGDIAAVDHVRRLHISMSFTCLKSYEVNAN